MSGTQQDVAQSVAEAIGADTAPGAEVGQSVAEAIGADTAPTQSVGQSVVEAVGKPSNTIVRVAQLIVEVVATQPPYRGAFVRERFFPLGYKGYPARPPRIAGNPYS